MPLERNAPPRQSWLFLLGVPALGIALLLGFFFFLLPWAITKTTEVGLAVLARDYGVQVELDSFELRPTSDLLASQKFGFDLRGLRVAMPANHMEFSIGQMGLDMDLAALSRGSLIVEEFLLADLDARLSRKPAGESLPEAVVGGDTAQPAYLRQSVASLAQAWDALPFDVSIRRFVVRNPQISMGVDETASGANTEWNSEPRQTIQMKGDLAAGLDLPRAGAHARLQLDFSKSNFDVNQFASALRVQGNVERGILGVELERERGKTGSASVFRFALAETDIALKDIHFSQQVAGDGESSYGLSGMSVKVLGRDGRRCSIAVDQTADAAFQDPALVQISPCEVVAKLDGPTMSSPEKAVSFAADDLSVALNIVHSSAFSVTEGNAQGTQSFAVPDVALSLKVNRLDRALGSVHATLKPLGGDRLSIDPSANFDLGEFSAGIAGVSAAGASEAALRKVEKSLSQFRDMLLGARLRAGMRLELGRAWVFEALAGKISQPAAARPSVNAWFIMSQDVEAGAAGAKGNSSQDQPEAESLTVSVFELVEGRMASSPQRAQAFPRGPWVAGAFQAGLEDLVLEARIGVRASQARSWKFRDSSLMAATFHSHARWVLWPSGRVPQAGQISKAPLSSVPAFFDALLQTTPLQEWSARSLRTLSLDGGVSLDGLHVAEQIRQQFNLMGLAELTRLRADVRLNVDEEGTLRVEQSGAQGVARFAAGDVPAMATAATAAGAGSPNEITAKFDLQADVARDFSAGSVGGKLVLEVPQIISLRNGSGSTSARGRVEIPFKGVGQRSNGVLQSVVLEASLLAKSVDFVHASLGSAKGNERELRVSGLGGEFPIKEQVALYPVSGTDRILPFVLSWEPLLAENPFRRAGFKLGGPYSRTRNIVIKKVEYGTLALGPLAATAAVNQNQILIDQMDGELFTGVITGQCFVNFDPAAPVIDFGGRVTGVDGARMLGFDGLDKANAVLSGRAALSYAVEESTISGRVDVERIPKPLIERVLARVDPSGADSKIGGARLALGIAAPGRLGVEMHDGLADLTLEILTKGVGPSEVRIPALPLTKVLEGRSGALRRVIEGTVAPSSGSLGGTSRD